MLKNFFIISVRNLSRQKLFSLINVLGLAVGMACSILISLWVIDELSFDSFHANADRIHRVVENQYYAGGELFPVAVTPGPLAQSLKDNYPEIENATRITWRNRAVKYENKVLREGLLYADQSMFDIFTFPVLQGNAKELLTDNYSIVLTEEAVGKYFGNENPLGKQIQINDISVQVTGIIKNIPQNSHMDFELIVPFELLKEEGTSIDSWGNNSYYTYVLLNKSANIAFVNDKIKEEIKKHNEGSSTDIYLQPLLDIHLFSGSTFTADIGGHGSIEYVRIFSIVAVFVLLIACINFMNLSTARSAKRAREVGMRKSVGAYKMQIINQFFAESIITALISLFFSLIIVYLTLPLFNEITGKEMLFGDVSITMFAGIVVLAVITGLIAGSYPALYLSSFQPSQVLRENRFSGKKGSTFRRTLVILQYSLSIAFIISTFVIYNQLDFIQNKNLGFNKDNIVYFSPGPNSSDRIESIKSEYLKNPDVLSVTTGSNIPTYFGNSTSDFDWEGKNPEESILFHFASVDEDYQKTFQIEMAKGRFFKKNFVSDTSAIVINETCANIIGYDDPIGKRLTMWGDDLTIIGVVKNFHFKKLDRTIEPLVLRVAPSWNDIMFARINGNNVTETMNFIESKYAELFPGAPFEFTFLDESFDRLYRSEQKLGKIFNTFSVLAIFISCLGLFGLSAFMAERRTKEIGIRKVMGAKVSTLTILLSKEFTILVILSNILAWPVAYYFMNEWLQGFAYRIALPYWLFPAAGMLALLIAFITVSFQTIKAAYTNPIDAIKYE